MAYYIQQVIQLCWRFLIELLPIVGTGSGEWLPLLVLCNHPLTDVTDP